MIIMRVAVTWSNSQVENSDVCWIVVLVLRCCLWQKLFCKIGLRLVAQLVATLAVGRPGWGTEQFKIFSQGISDHGTDQPPAQPAFLNISWSSWSLCSAWCRTLGRGQAQLDWARHCNKACRRWMGLGLPWWHWCSPLKRCLFGAPIHRSRAHYWPIFSK